MSHGINFMNKFVKYNVTDKNGKILQYSDYTKYLKNKSKTENKKVDLSHQKYQSYFSYVYNEEKTNGTFSDKSDKVDKKEMIEIKKYFHDAQKNKSNMWQQVFSFDNDWLSEVGLLDKQTNILNESKIYQAVRNAMKVMKDKEKFPEIKYYGAIHYDQDNIHIHVAVTEKVPTRKWQKNDLGQWEQRGKLKQSTQDAMKSKFGNSLLSHDYLFKIDELLRGIVNDKDTPNNSTDKKLKKETIKLFNEFKDTLPDKLQYYRTLDTESREQLNKLTEHYLDSYFKEEYQELNDILNKQEEIYHRMYGEVQEWDQYKYNKLFGTSKNNPGLYCRFGNRLLKEIYTIKKLERTDDLKKDLNITKKSFIEDKKSEKEQLYKDKQILYKKNFRKWIAKKRTEQQLKRILNSTKYDIEKAKNISDFENLQWRINHQEKIQNQERN